jgi:glycosyltransferase involved in cell wall biosynthesis
LTESNPTSLSNGSATGACNRSDKGSPVFFTIASRNYLGYAITLMQSVAAQYPDSPRYLCMVDHEDPQDLLESPWFEVTGIEQLGLPNFEAFVFRYDILELNTAVKPWMFNWLRRRHPHQPMIYLDPDILVVDRLLAVEEALAAGASLVLTPHLLEPIEDDAHPDELAILRAGSYNCGFVAIGAHPLAERVLTWWSSKLEHGCRVDLAEGLFTDQKWMDLAPGMFDSVCILRDPGYNVAYWNVSQRPVSQRNRKWYAAGRPLAFVHFSGVPLDDPSRFSRHQNRHTSETIGPLRTLFFKYLALLAANGVHESAKRAYGFGSFADGMPISQAHRSVYRRLWDMNSANPINLPLHMDRQRFDEPADEIPRRDRLPVTHLMYEIWRQRADLRNAFDLGEDKGRSAYIRWFIDSAERELGLAECHIRDVRAAFEPGVPGTSGQLVNIGLTARNAEATPAAREPLRRFPAACLALIDWTCRYRLALALYSLVPGKVRIRLRNRLEYLAYGQLPASIQSPAVELSNSTALPLDGLNLIGYARGEFGVAQILRSFARTLHNSPISFSVRNFEVGVRSRQDDRSMDAFLANDLQHSINLFFVNADQMPVVHDHLGKPSFAGRYNIGYWFWELERFPAEWDGAIDLIDEVWVATDFIRAAVQARTDKPVVVIPNAVELENAKQLDRKHFDIPEEALVFLFSCDFNSWISRKNPEASISAFRKAFASHRKDVRLIIKTTNGHQHADQLNALIDSVADDSRIEVRDGFLSRSAMWDLQACCDAYISLHRAEGFGLGMAESMLLGKPVVATGYSGNMDFMNSDNSCLVDFSLIALNPGDYPFWKDQVWAEPDVDQASSYLRRLADEPDYARGIGQRARESLREKRANAATLAAIQSRLADIRAARLETNRKLGRENRIDDRKLIHE